ncbi:hypothetical protein ACTJKO_14940 [Curtobacterium sp. 22159]|uniref:hypothetical protein n=1 Tax=Curtobacterium sp. 22159 TaxID=3453882 RepID=UPI003F82D51B
MHLTVRAAKTGTLVLVVAGLTGAVLHSLPEPADHAVRPTVGRDLDAWTMPLDGYVQPSGSKQDYASALVEQPCLRRIGIDFPPPWATVAGLDAEGDADDGPGRGNPSPALAWSRPLSADAASARGYHPASTEGANRSGWQAWGEDPERNAAFARARQQDVARCAHDAYRTLGTDDGDQGASALAEHLTWVAADTARRDPGVVAAAGRWRSCLASDAPGALPEDPHGMPTVAMREAFGIGAPTMPVSADERTLAERDVACQTSSGYRRALYDAQWSELLRVTATDAAVLARADGDQAEVGQRLDRWIERLAPDAPDGVD